MKFQWADYESLINLLRKSYELHMNFWNLGMKFLQNLFELKMKFMWTSDKPLMNFLLEIPLWTLYELLTNFLRNF